MALPPASDPSPWPDALDVFVDKIEMRPNEAAPPRLPPAERGERPEISGTVRALVFARDGHTCRWCGLHDRDWQPGLPGLLVLDHVLPFSRGGCSCSRNLRSLCWTCNQRRSDTVLAGDRDHEMIGVVHFCDTCQVDPYRLNPDDDTPCSAPRRRARIANMSPCSAGIAA